MLLDQVDGGTIVGRRPRGFYSLPAGTKRGGDLCRCISLIPEFLPHTLDLLNFVPGSF